MYSSRNISFIKERKVDDKGDNIVNSLAIYSNPYIDKKPMDYNKKQLDRIFQINSEESSIIFDSSVE